MIDQVLYTFTKLNEDFETDKFKCGVYTLDYFLKKHALRNQKSNLNQTYILHEKTNKEIIGYYTISTTNVIKSEIPDGLTSNFPNYPIPCILIGRLAVNQIYQKKGIGKFILFDALKRAKETSIIVGCFAVIVEAIDENVVTFYESYGFIKFNNKKLSLFLPVSSIP